MIVIPTGTDAPIYHWPYATAGLIVLNIALFFAIPPDSTVIQLDDNDEVVESVESVSRFNRYALALGDGRLHPTQWVTHNFLHSGLGHLAGNLLFLWAFGIVVEGKLGLVKFLLAYLTIGTLHGAFVQLLLMRSGIDGHAAGASAIVYGLLAVCMTWAPRNELNCTVILLVGFRVLVFHWDLYYTTVALLYIGEQILNLVLGGALGGQIMVSEMGHLSGALWGAVVAVGLLKLGWVDCEDWDVFSLLRKRAKLAHEWQKRGERLEREKEVLRSSLRATMKTKQRAKGASNGKTGDGPPAADRAATAVQRVVTLIDQREVAGALLAYDHAARTLVNWPPQPDLLRMIKSLGAIGADSDAIRLMRDHCRYYPAASSRVQLKLAQVLIRDRQRPAAALRVLGEIPPDSLPVDLELARKKLTQQATRMCEDGVLELEEDD